MRLEMLERGERLRLAFKPRKTFGIPGNRVRQKLQGHIALEPRIARTVDLSHAPGSESGNDFVRPDPAAGSE